MSRDTKSGRQVYEGAMKASTDALLAADDEIATLRADLAKAREAVAEVARLKEALAGLLAAAERMVDKYPVMGRTDAEAMDAAARALGRTDGEG